MLCQEGGAFEVSLFLLRLFWHFVHSLLDVCACCHGGHAALAHTIAKIAQISEFESAVDRQDRDTWVVMKNWRGANLSQGAEASELIRLISGLSKSDGLDMHDNHDRHSMEIILR